MRRILLAWAAMLAVFGGPAGGHADSDEEKRAWLRDTLKTTVQGADLAGATVAFAVIDAGTGLMVADSNADLGQSIASNVKLITAAAALRLLGPDYRFRTIIAGTREGSVIKGPLYVKGFADPTLGEEEIATMARQLVNRGLRRIEGPLILDESFFDDQREPPLFMTRTTAATYRMPIGALSVAANALHAIISPGETVSSSARITIHPRGSLIALEGRVVTGHRRTRLRWQVEETEERIRLRLSGRIRLGDAPRQRAQRINSPGLLFRSTFEDALRREGIRRSQATCLPGTLPATIPILVTYWSRPLAEVIREMNKRSDNFIAEQLLKTIGAETAGVPGTWEKGLLALRRYLASIGIDEGSYELHNGSGLYESSRFSPLQVATLIRSALRDFRVGSEFITSLPIAGVDGTLEKRFLGSGVEHYVRAKTGTLNHIVALSGVVGSPRGADLLIFSILINQIPLNKTRRARDLADRLAQLMVTYLDKKKGGSI